MSTDALQGVCKKVHSANGTMLTKGNSPASPTILRWSRGVGTNQGGQIHD